MKLEKNCFILKCRFCRFEITHVRSIFPPSQLFKQVDPLLKSLRFIIPVGFKIPGDLFNGFDISATVSVFGEKFVGDRQFSILKTNTKAQKALFYIDQSAVYAGNQAIYDLAQQGGHDKSKCSTHVISTIPYIKKNYGIDIYGCGLCQVSVSCSSGIPRKKND